MMLSRLVPQIIAAVLVCAAQQLTLATPATPYLEEFVSDTQDWINGKSTSATTIPATWEATGGPGGSSYISTTMNTATNALDSSRIIFRGNSIALPETHASDDKFRGDWIAGGINHLSFWAYHEAPVPLPFFARIATNGNFPAVAVQGAPDVQPNTWTKIDYILDPSYIDSTITIETAATTLEQKFAEYAQILSSVERVQVGFNTPAAMAQVGTPNTNPVASTAYKYGVDKIEVYTGSIPEPGSICLVILAVGLGMLGRRRIR